MPVVGYLSVTSAPSSPNMPFLATFAQGLSETGYVEGQNLTRLRLRPTRHVEVAPVGGS